MYAEIFNEIVSITHHDYSGSEDKRGWDNPEKYKDQIALLEESNELTPESFINLVQDYLLDFKDRHMYFKLAGSKVHKVHDNGFQVKRFGDKLYITQVSKEKRANIGDVILSLDNRPISELARKHKRELIEDVAERENWKQVIQKYSNCEVKEINGDIKMIDLKQYEKSKYVPQHTVQKVNNDTLLMTLSDFSSLTAIPDLIADVEEDLQTVPNLIVDVRENGGGSDAAYKELMPYLFPEGSTHVTFEDSMHSYHCTRRNFELTKKYLGQFMEEVQDKELKEHLHMFLVKFEENVGNGFKILFEETPSMTIEGKKFPQQVVVLTDVNCGSAGEDFVESCKKSSKATVIGRSTAGVNNYSNLTIMEWEGVFELWYPTSRIEYGLNKKDRVKNGGIAPDIYIPWTPRHITEDVDLNRAVQFLHSS